MRKIIQESASLCEKHGITDWASKVITIRGSSKKLYQKIQRLKHSTSKDEEKRKAKEKEIHQAYEAYIAQAERYLEKNTQKPWIRSKTWSKINLLKKNFP